MSILRVNNHLRVTQKEKEETSRIFQISVENLNWVAIYNSALHDMEIDSLKVDYPLGITIPKEISESVLHGSQAHSPGRHGSRLFHLCNTKLSSVAVVIGCSAFRVAGP